MKTNFFINGTFALLVTSSFYSCIKDPVDPPIIIDPVYPVYETKWESVEVRSDLTAWEAKWLPLAGADTLQLFSSDLEKSIQRRGYFRYIPYFSREQNPKVGQQGLFVQSASQLVFIDAKSSAMDPDTIAKAGYKLMGDTLIIYGKSEAKKFKKVKVTK